MFVKIITKVIIFGISADKYAALGRVNFNGASVKIALKAADIGDSPRLDGVLRANMPAYDGEVRDTAFYSLLLEEWPAAKADLKSRLR